MFSVKYHQRKRRYPRIFVVMKNVYTSKTVLPGHEATAKPGLPIFDDGMNLLIKILTKLDQQDLN
jgi:hypothetical protein